MPMWSGNLASIAIGIGQMLLGILLCVRTRRTKDAESSAAG